MAELARPKQPLESRSEKALNTAIATYWNEHIHDLEIATYPIGTAEFFQELATYRFEKLHYLPRLIDFSAYRGRCLLEVGCGLGLDLARFAQGGAIVTGVDLSATAVELARQYFDQQGLTAELFVMDGEALQYDDGSFDVVYAHGVLPYAADPQRLIHEIYRVLRPGGEAILMAYNRYSWLNALSKMMKVSLEHEDAPVLRKLSSRQLRQYCRPFAQIHIVPERFPVKTQLHHGLKAMLFNQLFVGAFNLLPRAAVRPFGWHLMAFARK